MGMARRVLDRGIPRCRGGETSLPGEVPAMGRCFCSEKRRSRGDRVGRDVAVQVLKARLISLAQVASAGVRSEQDTPPRVASPDK